MRGLLEHPRRSAPLVGLLVVGALGAGPARADEPRRFERVRAASADVGRVALEGFTSLSFVDFERPDRACGRVPGRPNQLPGGCPGTSSEVTFTVGGSLAVRAFGPVHLTWGLGVGYTDPQFDVLAPQTVVTMPFGVLFTWPRWTVRPLLEATLTPFVLLPDGVKNVMAGGRAGVAFRAGEVDVGVTLGASTSDAFRPVEVRLVLLHVP